MFFNDSQKGVSLLITFFVMAISLAIVLGITVILLGEIKTIRGMGYSIKAFCAADTGLEKTIYYDRKVFDSLTQERGICSICTNCPDCASCSAVDVEDGGCDSCTSCEVSYSNNLGGEKSFQIEATVSQGSLEGDIFQSFGTYQTITRAIELSFGARGGEFLAPMIFNAFVIPRSVPEGVALDITADISDPDGVDANTVIAYIQYPNEHDIDTVTLIFDSGTTYKNTWIGPIGFYYVDIAACDTKGNCSEKEDI